LLDKEKEAIRSRILKYNSSTGRTIKAFDKVMSTSYPAGTNLVIEFVKEFKNLPYGDDSKRLDKKADCSQFWINVLYYWFNIDHLGSYTESMYKAKGTEYKSFESAPELSIILYKLSDRNPHATHAAGKISAIEIGDTRSTLNPFMIRNWKWKTDKITRIVDFLTPEQRESVIVKDSGGSKPAETKPVFTRILKSKKVKNVYQYRGEDVKTLQKTLKAKGYNIGNSDVDGIFGEDTKKAVKAFQKSKKITVDGVVGKQTVTALGGVWQPKK
jgi:hypothetical protein